MNPGDQQRCQQVAQACRMLPGVPAVAGTTERPQEHARNVLQRIAARYWRWR